MKNTSRMMFLLLFGFIFLMENALAMSLSEETVSRMALQQSVREFGLQDYPNAHINKQPALAEYPKKFPCEADFKLHEKENVSPTFKIKKTESKRVDGLSFDMSKLSMKHRKKPACCRRLDFGMSTPFVDLGEYTEMFSDGIAFSVSDSDSDYDNNGELIRPPHDFKRSHKVRPLSSDKRKKLAFQRALEKGVFLQKKEKEIRAMLLQSKSVTQVTKALRKKLAHANPHARSKDAYSLFEEALIKVLEIMALRYKKYIVNERRLYPLLSPFVYFESVNSLMRNLLADITDYIADKKGYRNLAYFDGEDPLDVKLLENILYLEYFWPTIKEFGTMVQSIEHISKHYIAMKKEPADSLILADCVLLTMDFLPFNHPQKAVLINSLKTFVK